MKRIRCSLARLSTNRFAGGDLRHLCATLTAALLIMAPFESQALPPRGRAVEGIITEVNTKRATATMRTVDGEILNFRWDHAARYGTGQFPRKGAEVSARYVRPFFGEPFVTRMTVHSHGDQPGK
jgi:hypothetical protein